MSNPLAFFALLSGCCSAYVLEDVVEAPVAMRIPAEEARQGVASDGEHVYAIDNDRIGKYEIATGSRIATWRSGQSPFRHMNSCSVVERELVCAASNYPSIPQASAVEFFDLDTLKHLRTVPLPLMQGSLTAIDRHDGKWWAVLANYDGRGGEPGRDHRHTRLVRLDGAFKQEAAWTFPAEVLDRFAPRSCSGASWGRDGKLFVTGHDRPELYQLDVPPGRSALKLVRTIAIASPGQAIDWDPRMPRRLWSIDRNTRMLVASDIR